MIASEGEPTGALMRQLSGDFLFVAGSDLYNPLNQPSQHMPYHLARHLDRLDVVGYTRFYDGPPAPAWKRLKQGMRNVVSRRITISEAGHVRTIAPHPCSGRMGRIVIMCSRPLKGLSGRSSMGRALLRGKKTALGSCLRIVPSGVYGFWRGGCRKELMLCSLSPLRRRAGA